MSHQVFNRRFSLFVGMRYAGNWRSSQLVSFISAISILGLTLGIGLLLTVLSVMNGFDKELRERILGIMPHGAIYHRQGIDDWAMLRGELIQDSEVLDAAPFIESHAMLSYHNRVASVMVYSIDPELEQRISVIGQFADMSLLSGQAAEDNPLLLGRGVADKLRAEIGATLTVLIPDRGDARRMPRLVPFTLVGVIETGTELDHSLALSNLSAGQRLSNAGGVSGLRLQVVELFAAQDTVRRLVNGLGYGYYGTDWSRTHGNLYHAIHVSKNLVGLLLFLIVAIAAFNVVSTLVMVVVDKQADIAILKTLGAGRADVLMVFMVQGTLIGLLGCLLGGLLGVFGSLMAGDLFALVQRLTGAHLLDSEVYPIDYLPSAMQATDFLWVMSISLLLSLLASLYPAWRASRVAPADALRYE